MSYLSPFCISHRQSTNQRLQHKSTRRWPLLLLSFVILPDHLHLTLQVWLPLRPEWPLLHKIDHFRSLHSPKCPARWESSRLVTDIVHQWFTLLLPSRKSSCSGSTKKASSISSKILLWAWRTESFGTRLHCSIGRILLVSLLRSCLEIQAQVRCPLLLERVLWCKDLIVVPFTLSLLSQTGSFIDAAYPLDGSLMRLRAVLNLSRPLIVL